jgi:beta-lactam-binding protein with PASTA domain
MDNSVDNSAENKKTKESFSQKVKRWGREVFLFLTSFIFLKNLVGIFAFLGLLFFCTTWWMTCYTNHGESLQVHDYVGLELDDAIRKAKSRSFSIVVNDSIYIPGKSPNVVIGQNPTPLSRVKEDRKIYLSITKTIADLLTLPNLFDGSDDYYSYQTKLERLGLKSRIVGRQYSSKLEENTILEVIYGKDTITDDLDKKIQVPEGVEIGFIVTEKGGGSVPVPNLICQKYDAARFVIGNYNLNIGSVIKDATVTSETTAYVYKQVPRYSASKSVRVGEQIDLYLTQQRPDNCGKDEFNIEDLGEPEEEMKFKTTTIPAPTSKPVPTPTTEGGTEEEEEEEDF